MAADRNLIRLVRNKFVAGLIILVPIVITVQALWWLFAFVDDRSAPLAVAVFDEKIPGLGFATTLVLVLVTGFLFSVGPLRWRPYVSGAYHPGKFRWVMESGGGQIRDRGAHVMSVILWCMDADEQTPVRVATTGSPQSWGVWDCPAEMRVVYTFRDPDWQLIWEQPGQSRGSGGFGMVFHGDDDELVVCRDGTRIPAEEKAQNFKVPAGGVEVYKMDKHADYNMNHKEDWFQAIKTGRKSCMDIEAGHQAAVMCILGNLSFLLGRKLFWDGEKQEFIGDPQANRMLGQPQRHPYHL